MNTQSVDGVACHPARAARANPKIAEMLAGTTVHNVVVTPKRLVNFVVP